MIVRIVSRLVLLLAGLALATALVVGAISLMTSTRPGAAPLVARDRVAAVHRTVQAPADGERAADTSPSPTVVLVLAGIVLLAAVPPIHRVPFHRHGDWH